MPRGSRRASLRDNLPPFLERDNESMDQRLRRTARRESSEERRAERERYFAGARLTSRAERETPESLRAYLYEDPLIESSQRDAGTAAPGRLTARQQHLFERQRLQHGNSGDSANSSWNMSSDQPSRDLQRRFSREPPPRRTETLPSFASLTSAASLPPLRYLGTRRGWNNESNPSGPSSHSTRQRFERISDRDRTQAEQRPAPANPPSFEDLEPLDDANTHLRALLEYTNSTVTAPPRFPTSYSTPQHEHTEDTRRVKRRKLDPERHGAGSQGFRYGKYGQVEPGQLRLEIETCDGGVYGSEEENPPESILKNDDSVYVWKHPTPLRFTCTKQNRCNIVLRHQGSTVFTLAEVVLKAPGPRFSAPVREGMIFVSMESDEIFTRTSQYQVQFVPKDRILKREDRTPIVSIRHNDNGTTTRFVRRDRIFNTSCLDAMEYKTAVFPVEPLQFPYTIATDCSDTEDSTHHSRTQQPPNRIGALAFEGDSSEDGENALGSWRFNNIDDYGTPPPEHRRRVEDMTLAEAAEASQLATQEAVQAVGGALLAPHAKFFIEKGKNRCTIKFDPPVTGRYILLKMYHPTENIDIQGVYAKGFAGPRFFPSVELR